jgi:predicted porin
MKKSLIVLAALGAFAGVASAQSSVTLFGIIDLSVNSFKNGTVKSTQMSNSQLNSSRLGFRGTEDLGGGLSAGFWLEGSANADVGSAGGGNNLKANVTNGAFFERRSTVSLTSATLGELRLGRDYTNSFLTVATFDAYGANGFGNILNLYASGAAGMGSGAGTAVRANNMIGYFLPGALGGVYGSAQFALGEGVGTAAAADAGTTQDRFNKYEGFRLGYAAGPFDISGGFSKTETGVDDYKTMNIGASYNLGVAKIIGAYDQRKFGVKKYITTGISASVPLGQGEFRASYARGNASGGGTDANDSTLFGMEYIYNMSKRTAIYTQYGQVSNKGTAAASVGGGLGSAAGAKSTGYGVGVRHMF